MGKGKAKRRDAAGATGELEVAERHDFVAGMLGHDPTSYAVNVSERIALGVDVAQACVRTLADAVSDARWGEWRDTVQLPPSRLVRRPMGSWTRRRWLWRITATLALYNVCHLERVGEDADGSALSLVPLRPGQLQRHPSGGLAILEADGGWRPVSEDRIRTVRRADWPTVTDEIGTILNLSRSAFAAAWAADAYRSDFWEHGGAPTIVLKTDQGITNDTADQWRDRWVERRLAAPGAPAVLGSGLDARPLGADMAAKGSGEDLDRLGSSIARLFGMPAWIVNVASAAGSMVYSNTESAGADLVRYGLRGYLGPIEDEVSDELPGDYIVGRALRLDVSHLTMGTLKERFEAYRIALDPSAPFMTTDEVRRELNLPPDAGLDPRGAPAPAIESIPGGLPA